MNLSRQQIITALLILSLLLFAILWFLPSNWLGSLLEIFTERQRLIDWVSGYGKYAPMAFIALQAFQVIIAPFPGELTGAIGGALFGGIWGTVYATIGLIIGSGTAFLIGRYFAHLIERHTHSERFEHYMAYLKHEKAFYYIIILFIVPGFPKDILSYISGLSPVGFWTFLFLSNLARLPGTLMLCMSGDFVMTGNWSWLIAIAILSLVVFLIGRQVHRRFKSPDLKR